MIDFRWNLLQLKAQEQKIARVFDVFRSNGIEPILFKGWAAATYYPEMTQRRLGDVDIAVPGNLYHNAKLLVRTRELSSVLIDLHNEFRQLDTVSWQDVFQNCETVEVAGTLVRMPRREDHLRILAAHWLTDGGRFREKLWDIYYAVENRPSTFDWQRCLDIVEPNRRAWIICAIALAHRFLALKIDDIPFAEELRFIPSWISGCVEREWEAADTLEPILTSVNDKRLLYRQIKRRFPPNPIRATIEANGDLYGPWRRWYQFMVLVRRSTPFARDCVRFISQKLKRVNN